MDDNQIAEINDTISNQLLKVQSESDTRNLCHQDPERWRIVATMLAANKPLQHIEQETGTSFYCIKKIQRELDGTIDAYKARQATKGEILVDLADEIAINHLNNVAQTGELTPEAAKAWKEWNAGSGILSQRVNRSRGEADQIVEKREAKTPDQLKAELEQMFAQIPEAEIVDE